METDNKKHQEQRHEMLRSLYSMLVSKSVSIGTIFNAPKTVHADLELMWIDTDFQEKNFSSSKDFQIVIATVKPGQTSEAHMHKVGASSFIVLGPNVGAPEPKNLIYRTGRMSDPSGTVATKDSEIKCSEELEIDISPYQVHQFENRQTEPAQVLIVTHPPILVEEGKEDIYFSPLKK